MRICRTFGLTGFQSWEWLITGLTAEGAENPEQYCFFVRERRLSHQTAECVKADPVDSDFGYYRDVS